MDIRCPICAEPWDADILHEEVNERWPDAPWEPKNFNRTAETFEARQRRQSNYEQKYYNVVKADFRRRGCVSLEVSRGTTPCEPTPNRAAAAAIMAVMSMSDHADDWATDMADAEQLGLFS